MRLGFLVCKLKLDDGAASRRDGKSRYGTLLLHIDLGISHDKDALLEVAAPVATGEREHMLAGIVSELTLYGKVRGLHAQHARHLGGDDTREECGHRGGRMCLENNNANERNERDDIIVGFGIIEE